MPKNHTVFRRGRPLFLLVATVAAFVTASLPMSLPAFAAWRYDTLRNSEDYKRTHGYWQTLNVPEEFRLNTIHAALLPTGKVLLVAGTGNNREAFNAYYDGGDISVNKTAVLDPETLSFKLVETPRDLFCSGHAFLQSGNLLVAGGTVGYEVLAENVKKPAGPMIFHNEDPDSPVRTFPKGTRLVSPTGKTYVTLQDVVLPPAHKNDYGFGNVEIHHSSAKVFVEAVGEDDSYLTTQFEQYSIEGLNGLDAQNMYGQGGPMTRNKQDFRGDNAAYEFDPITEEYVQVESMDEGRWYPSLPIMTNGNVLAVSGLDNTGIVTDVSEWYDPATRTWNTGPNRFFPTYPALFRTRDSNVLFFSGSSAGYGPEDTGREPGFWNVVDNSFRAVEGLRDTDILETSASVILPPRQGSNDGSQSERIMLAGGGGIGESELVTARTDIIDLSDPNPRYVPGPDLPEAVRYPNMTVTPWDEVIGMGGTHDYRAKGNSYSYATYSVNPTTNSITALAPTDIGRGYHSGSLLLPDGRILVFGGDPLFADKDNTRSGTFEQRIELFTPPQLFRGERPITNYSHLGTQQVRRGEKLMVGVSSSAPIQSARLIAPSSTTHVTNIEQRSVGAVVTITDSQATVSLPTDEYTLPNGWYMLFLVDANGTPSIAHMIQIVR